MCTCITVGMLRGKVWLGSTSPHGSAGSNREREAVEGGNLIKGALFCFVILVESSLSFKREIGNKFQ